MLNPPELLTKTTLHRNNMKKKKKVTIVRTKNCSYWPQEFGYILHSLHSILSKDSAEFPAFTSLLFSSLHTKEQLQTHETDDHIWVKAVNVQIFSAVQRQKEQHHFISGFPQCQHNPTKSSSAAAEGSSQLWQTHRRTFIWWKMKDYTSTHQY